MFTSSCLCLLWYRKNIFNKFSCISHYSELIMSDQKTDWNLCIICQDVISESLQCPAQVTRSDVTIGAGYESFVTNLQRDRCITNDQ